MNKGAKRSVFRRKTVSIFLSAAMCLSCIPFSFAQEQESDDDDSVYTALEEKLEQDGASETDYSGYLIRLKDDSVSLSVKTEGSGESGDRTPTSGEGLEEMPYTPDLYRAESLEDIKNAVDESQIQYIEPDYTRRLYDADKKAEVAKPSRDSNDAHLDLINVPVAWEYGLRGEDFDTSYDVGGDGNGTDPIVIGVIDSGLAEGHEDIDYTHVIAGRNFASSNTESTADHQGHGTFVTGQILAGAENGLGIDGIAEDVYVMPLKVFVSDLTSDSIIINAIDYAVAQKQSYENTSGTEGANICVLNLSLGDSQSSNAVKDSVDRAIAAGIIVISAAGNDGNTLASYPAQYSIGVGSTDSSGEWSDYSQILSKYNGSGYENKVWVTAPGENYTSLWYNGSYYRGSGTSFSAPEVSALAAVALSIKNDLPAYYRGTEMETSCGTNHDAFRQLLKDTSHYKNAVSGQTFSTVDQREGSQDLYYGWGIVDFEKMIESLSVFSSTKGEPSEIRFSVTNGAGSALTAEENDLSVRVFAQDSGEPELSDPGTEDEIVPVDGIYLLEIGKKYRYEISAEKYVSFTGTIVPVTSKRTVNVVLEGRDYTASFHVTDTEGKILHDAEIEVTQDSGLTIPQKEDGSFDMKNGNYRYVVSAEGYLPQTGDFTIDDTAESYKDDAVLLNVILRSAADICSLNFHVTGADGAPQEEILVYGTDGNLIQPYSDGAWKLDPGQYTYIVESDYYQTVSGSFSVSEEDKGTEKTLNITMMYRLYWASFEIDPPEALNTEGFTITVQNAEGRIVEPFNRTDFRVVSGKYTYTIKARGYRDAQGTFSAYGESVAVPVTLQKQEESGGDSGGQSGGSGGSGASGGGSSGTEIQKPDIETSEGGSVSLSADGSTITITPDAGYEVEEVTVNGASKGALKSVSGLRTGDRVRITFKTNDTPGKQDYAEKYDVETVYHDLDDVKRENWFYEPVNYCITTGLFSGVGEKLFAPESFMSRAMTVTVLYRMSGSVLPENAKHPFTDVPDNAYYSDAVAWAYENKIVSGISAERFQPDSGVTRGQMIALLYRYAGSVKPDLNVSGSSAAGYFTDYGDLSSYAKDAAEWAYAEGVAAGDDLRRLNPKKQLKRCEAASMTAGFIRNVLL